jgi:flavorubredoxin
VVGSPIYDGRLFPLVTHCLGLLANKKLTGRLLGLVGMCAWSGGVGRTLADATETLGGEVVEPVVEVRCAATPDDLAAAETLGRSLATRILSL